MRAQVSAVAGAADLTAAGIAAAYRLHAGETATLDAAGADATPAQGATSPAAGQVSRLVPQVQIDRGSQHLVAAVSDRIYWNDDLRSGPTGRAHVTLKDGSQLNLGSDSSLRILQHDAQAQQTSLDLLVGRMRGKITKLIAPGAKFEVHTPMGIAGLVGTDFSLLVTDDYVELMVFEGAVRFTTFERSIRQRDRREYASNFEGRGVRRAVPSNPSGSADRPEPHRYQDRRSGKPGCSRRRDAFDRAARGYVVRQRGSSRHRRLAGHAPDGEYHNPVTGLPGQ